MTEEYERAWARMDATSKKIMVSPYKSGQGNENSYAAAYRELVRLGLAVKIKAKYNR